jgi:hypothetical protein
VKITEATYDGRRLENAVLVLVRTWASPAGSAGCPTVINCGKNTSNRRRGNPAGAAMDWFPVSVSRLCRVLVSPLNKTLYTESSVRGTTTVLATAGMMSSEESALRQAQEDPDDVCADQQCDAADKRGLTC